MSSITVFEATIIWIRWVHDKMAIKSLKI